MENSAKCRVPGLRLGGTSFLRQDQYVPAIRFAAAHCDDIALLLFETGKHDEWLISNAEVREIAAIGADENVTFNIHLPVDAHFATQTEAQRMVDKALLAIERTQPLSPHSFVLHVDFPELSGTGRMPTPEAQEWTVRSLEAIAAVLAAPEQLALENLEHFPTTFLHVWLHETACSRCFDIGHIWKDGLRPEALFPEWLPRTRLCHLHGVCCQENKRRDHTTLAHMPSEQLDAVMHPLWDVAFEGVITLELFSFDHFTTSCKALLESHERYCARF